MSNLIPCAGCITQNPDIDPFENDLNRPIRSSQESITQTLDSRKYFTVVELSIIIPKWMGPVSSNKVDLPKVTKAMRIAASDNNMAMIACRLVMLCAWALHAVATFPQ
jgi:hypothetical protein